LRPIKTAHRPTAFDLDEVRKVVVLSATEDSVDQISRHVRAWQRDAPQ
jgi:hypothetical protein